MNLIRASVMVVALFCSGAVAAQATCDQLNNAVEASLKELSFYSYSGLFDNSAPRSTDRKMEQAVHLDMIQANLILMEANKCPLPRQPITMNAYATDVSKCMSAPRAGEAGGKSLCDRSTWARDK